MSDCGRANCQHTHSSITFTIYSSQTVWPSISIASPQHAVGPRPHAPPNRPHLLASVHLFAVPVTVAQVGIHANQRAAGVCLVPRGNCQGGESCRWGCVKQLTHTLISGTCKGHTRHTQLPVMELRTSLEKEASTELP